MISIRFKAASFDKAVKWAAGLQAREQRAVDQAMQNGGNKVRTDIRRALVQTTGAKKYASIVSRTASAYKAFHGASIYTIFVRRGVMKIDEFPVSAGKGGITASPWGKARTFRRSFVLPGKDAGNAANFRARLPGESGQLRRLFGPNLAKEATEGNPARVFLISAQTQIGDDLLKRLGKALKG